MIHVCIPVLRRYDLLRNLLLSLKDQTVEVTAHVINNGMNPNEEIPRYVTTTIYTPPRPLGVAESWNWFIENVTEERVIVNDDVVLQKDSIEKLVAAKTDVAFALTCGFSLFVLRDRVVKRIGVFDETISPGYGYYEDDDYMARMRRGKITMSDIDCGAVHLNSQTLEAATPEQLEEHHRRFHIARGNFVRKWGMMPGDLYKAELAARPAQDSPEKPVGESKGQDGPAVPTASSDLEAPTTASLLGAEGPGR